MIENIKLVINVLVIGDNMVELHHQNVLLIYVFRQVQSNKLTKLSAVLSFFFFFSFFKIFFCGALQTLCLLIQCKKQDLYHELLVMVVS